MPRFSLPAVVALLALIAPSARAADGFALKDTPGQYLDITLDGKLAARYMYAHDASTPAKRLETYKPYLHVYDAQGKDPITQGAGGKLYPHHRGIYIGWQKLGFAGKTYNFWEMAGGDIVHTRFLDQKADADSASFTSETHWIPKNTDKPIVVEERTITVRRGPAPFRLLIDFTSKLTAPAGDVMLNGDPEHGGIQFRPHGDIVTADTTYLFPKENPNPRKDTDYPWVGETYTLHGHQYSVVEINHPDNPKGTRWSAYRDYGRFGAFPKSPLKQGATLTVKYRFLIADGPMPSADVIQKSANAFTNENTPTPQTTVKPADHAKPAKKPAR